MGETIEPVDVPSLARQVAGLADNGRRSLRMQRIELEHGRSVAQAVRRQAWHMVRSKPAPARRVETPAARAGDAESSHVAAEAMTANGRRAANQRIVAATVAMHPGCTSRELTQHCELDRVELGRRMSDCETAGTIKRGEMRCCAMGGRQALTWWPV